MNAHKIKNIFILILIFINVFLLHNYITLKTDSETFTDDEIQKVTHLLNEKGINIDPNTFPKSKKSHNIYLLSSNLNFADLLANNLFGESIEAFTIPEGLSYSKDDCNLIVRNNRSFLFNNASLPQNDYLDVINNIAAVSLDTEYKNKHLNIVQDFFNFEENDDKKELKAIGHFISNNIDYYIFSQTIDGIYLHNSDIIVAIKDNNIIAASGNFICTIPDNEYTVSYYDSANILFKIDPSEKKISEMSLVYYPINHNDDSFLLLPSYKLVFEDGSSTIYDAVSAIER